MLCILYNFLAIKTIIIAYMQDENIAKGLLQDLNYV